MFQYWRYQLTTVMLPDCGSRSAFFLRTLHADDAPKKSHRVEYLQPKASRPVCLLCSPVITALNVKQRDVQPLEIHHQIRLNRSLARVYRDSKKNQLLHVLCAEWATQRVWP